MYIYMYLYVYIICIYVMHPVCAGVRDPERAAGRHSHRVRARLGRAEVHDGRWLLRPRPRLLPRRSFSLYQFMYTQKECCTVYLAA